VFSHKNEHLSVQAKARISTPNRTLEMSCKNLTTKTAGVDKEVRGWEKTSDHAPVWIEIR
jgi:exonuclease III